jgi:hypothetical protein
LVHYWCTGTCLTKLGEEVFSEVRCMGQWTLLRFLWERYLREDSRIRPSVLLGFVAVVILLTAVLWIATSGLRGNTLPEGGSGSLTEGKRYVTDEFEPAFSFKAVGGGWRVAGEELPDILDIENEGSMLSFHNVEQVFDPEQLGQGGLSRVPAPQNMVEWFQGHPYLETGEPEPAKVGGISGVQFDAIVAEAPEEYPPRCPDPCAALFALTDQDWIFFEDHEKARIIILKDVQGETVTIILFGPALDFEEFLPKAQKVLKTVEWEGA